MPQEMLPSALLTEPPTVLLTVTEKLAILLAVQAFPAVLVPLYRPLHPHVQGPEPAKLATVVLFAQRFGEPELSDENVPPFAPPQAPLTGAFDMVIEYGVQAEFNPGASWART